MVLPECEDFAMRMLLTSGGVRPGPVQDALVDLLGKPLSDSRIVVVVDAILPFPATSRGCSSPSSSTTRSAGRSSTSSPCSAAHGP